MTNCTNIAAFLAISVGLTSPAAATEEPAIDLSGDVRMRLEQDWGSRTAVGDRRNDRTRVRIRARLRAAVELGDGFWFNAGLRTGLPQNQQGANVTFADFSGNPSESLRFVPDRYVLGWRHKGFGIEIGRTAVPFFTQNEYFLDGDLSPQGVSAGLSEDAGRDIKVRLTAGAFRMPAGHAFSGALYAGQATVKAKRATAAIGLFKFAADRNDPDRLLLADANGERDYGVLTLNAQYRLPAGKSDLTLGLDLYRNLQGYAGYTDPISQGFRDERTGFVLSAAWGDTRKTGNVQIGYRYFRIERLAMNASYAHDDVARLGNAQQAALTDLRGHDLFANYALNSRLTLGVRTMAARRISSREDGRRARIDLIYSF